MVIAKRWSFDDNLYPITTVPAHFLSQRHNYAFRARQQFRSLIHRQNKKYDGLLIEKAVLSAAEQHLGGESDGCRWHHRRRRKGPLGAIKANVILIEFRATPDRTKATANDHHFRSVSTFRRIVPLRTNSCSVRCGWIETHGTGGGGTTPLGWPPSGAT